MAFNNHSLVAVNRLRLKSGQVIFLNQLSVSALMFSASGALFINMIVTGGITSFISFLLTLTGTAILGKSHEVVKFFNSIQRWGHKYKLNIALLVFCLVGTVCFLDYTAAPANAQFFNQTESWLRSSFPINGGTGGGAGGTDIYKLVFNTLRAIFVLYLAVSLVRVIAAARNDDDWQTLARTPLIVLITVTLGDILAALITGGAGGGGGA
jgi:hypothetical protein